MLNKLNYSYERNRIYFFIFFLVIIIIFIVVVFIILIFIIIVVVITARITSRVIRSWTGSWTWARARSRIICIRLFRIVIVVRWFFIRALWVTFFLNSFLINNRKIYSNLELLTKYIITEKKKRKNAWEFTCMSSVTFLLFFFIVAFLYLSYSWNSATVRP